MNEGARALLRALVAAPSPSREEGPAVAVLEEWGRGGGLAPLRVGHNLGFVRSGPRPGPTLLLLTHHDTVPPTAAWTRDPFTPTEEGGRLYGLGANDAKGCVAAMAEAFRTAALPCGRLVFAPVAEEEVGRGGAEVFLPALAEALGPFDPARDAAIVGEPTGLHPAVCQSGLLVLDAVVRGRAGHAARPHLAHNPVYDLARDLLSLESLAAELAASPEAFGTGDEVATTLAVTVIAAGERHNVIPAEARYTVDLRSTPGRPNEALTALVRARVRAEVAVRSDRFHPVATPPGAPILRAVVAARPEGRPFASPTLSDWAHLGALPAVKWGPGRSEVSHTPDEWVELASVDAAVDAYRRTIEIFLAEGA